MMQYILFESLQRSHKEVAPRARISHWWYFGMRHMLERSYLRLHVSPLESDKCSLVAHLIAVVWRAKHCKGPAAFLILIPIVFDFMASYQEL